MGFFKTSLRAILIASAALLWSEPARGQGTVELGFEGPETLSAPAGETVSGSYFSTLQQTSGSTGAQGWSIIMDASNATFTSVTIAGTEANALVDREPCFGLPRCSFETYQMGSGFACSAVVLSFRNLTTLPTSGSTTIMQVGISTVVPQCGGSVTLEYLDVGGCFAGVANTNVVTIQGQSVTFANGLLSQVPLEVDVVSESPCDPAALLEQLVADVAALNANGGIKAALAAMLSAAIQLLEDADPSNDGGAANLIGAFISAVGAQSGSQISAEEAAALIDSAQAILDILAGA
jgi:hypothetical protein